ncbi:MAG: hypothetical protein ACLQU5_17295 [Isosphaeraceae bacterium]
MGWKTINGRRYYYKSRRVGSRVESTYFGPAGEFGALMAYIDGIERLEKAADRWREQEERDDANEEERAFAEWFDDVQAVSDAAMAEAGFHKHRGQWRRKRK